MKAPHVFRAEKDIKRRDMLSEYRWDFIFSYVKEHEECSRTAVLFSGDIGFYSGAKKLEAALLHSEIDCTVELIPGISSVVYLPQNSVFHGTMQRS